MFNNLKIKYKLLTAFAVIIIFVIGLSILGVVTASNNSKSFRYLIDFPEKRANTLLEVEGCFKEMRRCVTGIAFFHDNPGEIDKMSEGFIKAFNEAREKLKMYLELIETDEVISNEVKAQRITAYNNASKLMDQYKTTIYDQMHYSIVNEDMVGLSSIVISGAGLSSQLEQSIIDLVNLAYSQIGTMTEHTQTLVKDSITIMIVVMILTVAISVLMALLIARVISRPIEKIVVLASEVSKGNTNAHIPISNAKDEVGNLTKSFEKVTSIINSLMDSINEMAENHEKGEIDWRISEKNYPGMFMMVARSVNQMVDSHLKTTAKAMACVSEIVDGDFEADIEKLPGKKVFINDAINGMRDSIKSVNNEVMELTRYAVAGDLAQKINVTKYKGDWAKLMDGLNNVLGAVAAPLREATDALVMMSNGQLDVSVRTDYHGDYAVMMDALNKTVKAVSSYIEEINKVLGLMAGGDLTVSISREYVGDFKSIRESINTISQSLNKTMSDISSASGQVFDAARHISSSSMTLAEGATEQAGSIQDLSDSAERMNKQIAMTAKNSKSAEEFALKSMGNAKNGNEDMKAMLLAMDSIKDSSDNISKIIKTIEDIAFQTNLLALNAAVEAARAGTHGKGFAVVAEEVRSLSNRSQEAVKESTVLIADSINKVNYGTKIATDTASSLNAIVESAEQVSEVIRQIAASSNEQAEAISQINQGLGQISVVVQDNSSTSEESAAAAQELNSQAELLKQMIGYFRV